MGVLKFIQNHWTAIVIVAALALAGLFFWSDFTSVSLDFLEGRETQVRESLECAPTRIDGAILDLRKDKDDALRIFLHLNERPSSDVAEFLSGEGVVIYPESWLYDYVVADTQINRLCFLDALPGIAGVSLAE